MEKWIMLLLLLWVKMTFTQESNLVHLEAGPPSFVVSADKMNILYRGIDNPISFGGMGYDDASLKVEMTNGKLSKRIQKDEKGNRRVHYTAKIKEGNRTSFRFYSSKNGHDSFLGSMQFRVKPLPPPIPYVAQKTGFSDVPKAQLLASTKVFAKMEGFDMDIAIKVISYRIRITSCEGGPFDKTFEGNEITQETKNIISNLSDNDLVIFSDIFVRFPTGYWSIEKEWIGEDNIGELSEIILRIVN